MARGLVLWNLVSFNRLSSWQISQKSPRRQDLNRAGSRMQDIGSNLQRIAVIRESASNSLLCDMAADVEYEDWSLGVEGIFHDPNHRKKGVTIWVVEFLCVGWSRQLGPIRAEP